MRGCLANQGELDFEWNNFIGERAIDVFVLLAMTPLLATSTVVIASSEIFPFVLMGNVWQSSGCAALSTLR